MIDDPNPNLFATEIRNCAGSSVSLELWSAKGQRRHTVTIPVSAEDPSLGLTLQLAPLSASQQIWHVLQIPSAYSPAHFAGLIPHSDYILGTPSGTLRGESAFGELVEDHLNRSLTLWVYNSEFDVVREVELIPRRDWGGEGALGAVLGYGALHRLPMGLGEEVEGPGEVVFETKEPDSAAQGESVPPTSGGNNFLVPANIASPPPMTSPNAKVAPAPGRHSRKNRHAHPAGLSPNRSFDEYFRESEQKSKEQDVVPSRHGTPVAPPPKAGGPPRNTPPPPKAVSPSNGEPAPQTEEG
ncbi:hypothetical protein FQN54_007809 [Arachnomyces sp. PD_36]|nr:hypothetical protein FQN54_007809 [Arachnomyces sp. PD_36]